MQKSHEDFVRDLIVNLLDVIYKHEDYHDVALQFNTELQLSDGRVITIILGEGIRYE